MSGNEVAGTSGLLDLIVVAIILSGGWGSGSNRPLHAWSKDIAG
jgi:hypothetical protein